MSGRWHHVAGVFDGSEVRLYVDGELVAARPGHGSRRRNGLPLIIGGDVDGSGNSTSGFDGWIDEVRLSTCTRYDGDQFAPERRHAPDDDTVLLFHFDGFVGPFAADSSLQRSHAIRMGEPQVEPAE